MPIWHPDGRCFMAPLRRGGLHRRHDVFSGLGGTEQTSLRRQRHTFTQIPQGMKRRLQPLQKQLKMSALPHQHHLGDINVVLVITIIYSTKWQDRLWWPLLPAGAVSEPMIVPIELQLMLCPPKDEGHISPGIHGPTRAAPSRKSGMLLRRAAAILQSKAELLNPFEGDKSDEVADLRCTDGWLRTTSTERHECLSSLVGCVLVTDSTPGSISHAHFVVGTAEDYVKEKNISLGPVFPGTRAHMDKIPQGEPAPRTQKEQACEGTHRRVRSRGIGQQVGGGAIKLAFSAEPRQRWPEKVRSEGKHAAKAAQEIRFWTDIQGCMRQQPCAWSSKQPHVGTSNFQLYERYCRPSGQRNALLT